MADHQRHAAEQRGEGRHHDRAEAHQRSLADRLRAGEMLLALHLQREVHHHDAVLLDDADQQDHADQRDQAELVARQHQDRQSAEAGRRQGRENRQRVYEALIEHAQDDIDRQQRRQDQQRHSRQRFLERLRVALEGGLQSCRHAEFALRGVDRLRRLTERDIGREVEADRHRRKLALMADRKRSHGHGRPFGEGGKRHQLAGVRRLQIEQIEGLGVLLQRRRQLHDDVIGVDLGEELRHLPLAEGVVKRVVNLLRLDAETRRLISVDLQLQGRAIGLLIGADVAQFRQGAQLGQNLRRPFVQLRRIGVLKRVLELRQRRARADGDVLRGLHEDIDADDLRQLLAQPRDHLEGVDVAILARLQRDEHAAVILRGVAGARAQPHRHRVHRRIGLHDLADLLLQLDHLIERDVLTRDRGAEDHAGVLLREKPLRDLDEQPAGGGDSRQEDQHGDKTVAQRDVEAALVAARHRVERAFAHPVEPAMLGRVMLFQEPRGHHRRQRQRDAGGDADGHGDGDGELAEQPTDDAAHQQQRDQNRNQRNRDRDDGETDLARALDRGGIGLHALFDMALDVLQHHDGVVHHEADRNRQRHQREIVERIADRPHQRAGAEQRQRHGDARDHGRPEAAQEHEDDRDHEADGQQQRELHVLHRGADRRRAVGDHRHLDVGRDRRRQLAELFLDVVDRRDDIGAGLFEHDEEHAALALRPAGLRRVGRAVHRLPDVAHAHRRAVAIGDDDIVPFLGLGELVVVVDGEGLLLADQRALGIVDGRLRDLRAHVLKLEVLLDQLGRVDLDANRLLLLAADAHQRHAVDLAHPLRENILGDVVDVIERLDVGEDGENQDRRVGGVGLAIGRRARQVLRQLPAGGVDRRLHVVGRRVDVAVEVELDRDRGGAERGGRSHLRHAGDLRELSLQGLRNRGGHRLRRGAGKLGADGDGREVDLRQRRDREQRIGDEADQQHRQHEEGRRDRPADEEFGDATGHVSSAIALSGSRPERPAAIATARPSRSCRPPVRRRRARLPSRSGEAL